MSGEREWCAVCTIEVADDPLRAADGSAVCSHYCCGRHDEFSRAAIDRGTAWWCEPGHRHARPTTEEIAGPIPADIRVRAEAIVAHTAGRTPRTLP